MTPDHFHRTLYRPRLIELGNDDAHVWLVSVIIRSKDHYQSVEYHDRRGRRPIPDGDRTSIVRHELREGDQTPEEWAEETGFPVLCSHPNHGSIMRADTIAQEVMLTMRWGQRD